MNCWQFLFYQEFKPWLCWFAAKLMRSWNWWSAMISHRMRWLCLLRTVNAWEMRATVIGRRQRRLSHRTNPSQALRGAQGHPWSEAGREGWMRNRPSQSTSLPTEAKQALSWRLLRRSDAGFQRIVNRQSGTIEKIKNKEGSEFSLLIIRQPPTNASLMLIWVSPILWAEIARLWFKVEA